MPRWMRHYLYRRDLAQHLRISLVLALTLRILSAIFVYGPQALDDYKHGVWPAYQFFKGLPIDLPDYRSHLLIWCLAGCVKIASWFGAESALAQVRAMYLGLGVFSLTGLYGTYLFVANVRSRIFAALALYLVAAFPLMPFVSTRAFGESVAMSLVLLAFGVLENCRRNRASLIYWSCGFALLGLAVLFRFHVGLLFVAYGLALLARREWRGVAAGIIGGLLTIAGAYAVDVLSGKPAFGTLISYLTENEGGAAAYGVSPWYNSWAFVFAVSLAPFSFVFAKKIPALWRAHWMWFMPAFVFVLVHSLVPHKEERFLYPILGLEMWALAYVWASSALWPPASWLYTRVFLTVCAVALPIVCFVNSQEGEIEPPAYAESHYQDVAYLDFESLFGESKFKFYFLRPPSTLKHVSKDDLNASEIDEAINEDGLHRAVVLLTSVPEARDQLRALEGVKTEATHCLNVRAAGSPVDRLLFAMNPKHNQRRRPTWYLICERV